MTLQELHQQVLEMPDEDRWALLKLLIELLQPSNLETLAGTSGSTVTSGLDDPPLAQYYGCIDDETFVRHSQPE